MAGWSSNVRRALSGAWRYLKTRIQIDTRTLAVFRIAVGLLILADLLLRARTFTFLYTDGGAVPRELAMRATPDYAFSFYFLTSDARVVAALFVLQALFALQLIVGFKTTFAMIVSFLFVVSLDHQNPFVLSHADTLFRFLTFWAIFLPLGERWSIDAIRASRPPRPSIASLATAAILLQMTYMYLANGYHKTQSVLWVRGEATPLIFGLDDMTYLLGDPMRNFEALLTYGGWMWYYMLLFSWLLLLLPGNARTLFVMMFVVVHASFAITVRIGAFPFVAIAGVLLFLQAPFWKLAGSIVGRIGPLDRSIRRLQAQVKGVGHASATRIPRIEHGLQLPGPVRAMAYHSALIVATATVLVLPAASFLSNAGFTKVDPGGLEQRTGDAAAKIGIRQSQWTVFAPNPRTIDRYYVFPARTSDGEIIDIYNDRPVTFDRPYQQLQRQYGTYRERFYMNSVRRGGQTGGIPAALADYLCAYWMESRGVEITQINMYVVTEYVTRDTIADPAQRRSDISLIYTHGCGDHPAEEIALE
jgi:hypothetical protein